MTNLNLQTPISSYAERLKHTPKVHSDRGYWTGDRGNSLYCPKNAKVLDALHKFDLLGMPYIDAMLDPHQCCKFRINGAPFSRQRCKRLAPAVRYPFIACL